MPPKLNRKRALFVLTKIDEILAWERQKEAERDTRFVELGRYLCEVRAGQYWRLENLKSFDEFLARRFPESRLLDLFGAKTSQQGCFLQFLVRRQKYSTLGDVFTPCQRRCQLQRVCCPQIITVHKFRCLCAHRFRRLNDRPVVGKGCRDLTGLGPVARVELFHPN